MYEIVLYIKNYILALYIMYVHIKLLYESRSFFSFFFFYEYDPNLIFSQNNYMYLFNKIIIIERNNISELKHIYHFREINYSCVIHIFASLSLY